MTVFKHDDKSCPMCRGFAHQGGKANHLGIWKTLVFNAFTPEWSESAQVSVCLLCNPEYAAETPPEVKDMPYASRNYNNNPKLGRTNKQAEEAATADLIRMAGVNYGVNWNKERK